MGLLWSGLCVHTMHLHLLKLAHKQKKQTVPDSVKNSLRFADSARSGPLLEMGSCKLSAPLALIPRALPSFDTTLKDRSFFSRTHKLKDKEGDAQRERERERERERGGEIVEAMICLLMSFWSLSECLQYVH